MQLRRNPSRSLRRSVALTVGGLLLATPVLTSCGFNYATDRVYTPAAGANDRDASVDVLGAVIVSGEDGSGTFIATFTNNSVEDKNSVDSLAADTTSGSSTAPSLQAESFSPIKVQPGGLVNLAVEGGIPVTGTFVAGDFVPVTLTLGSGEQVSMDVPVVTDTGDYAGLDTSSTATESPSPSESTSESPSESPSASASE